MLCGSVGMYVSIQDDDGEIVGVSQITGARHRGNKGFHSNLVVVSTVAFLAVERVFKRVVEGGIEAFPLWIKGGIEAFPLWIKGGIEAFPLWIKLVESVGHEWVGAKE
jgi:hypothetical protein